ncbi:MAG: guanylate kinase [Pseudomonadota bacterium]
MTGRLLVIAAPSGAGKTSLVQALLEKEPRLRVSVSHTTRRSRLNEQDGREYYFVDTARFKAMADACEFLEHAQVFDNYYGTGRAQLEEKLASGFDVILEIDWQGARQVRAARPDCESIFILPPSREALEQRLNARRTDTPAVIARRLADAVTDMSHYGEFDYVVVNDRFEETVAQLRRILKGDGEEFRARRPALQPVLRNLLA